MVSQTQFQLEAFSGPIPPPEVLRQYDLVTDGAGDRLIALAEKEQQHRHDIVARAVEANIKRDTRGAWMGFAIAIIGLVISAAVIYFGRDNVGAVVGGSVLGGADFVLLVSLFLRQESREAKGEG
jgi:uncharacterized membrane protein